MYVMKGDIHLLVLVTCHLTVVASVGVRAVTVVARTVPLEDTDPLVETHLAPAVSAVTVPDVCPLRALAQPARVGGLVDVQRPDAAPVAGQHGAFPG